MVSAPFPTTSVNLLLHAYWPFSDVLVRQLGGINVITAESAGKRHAERQWLRTG